jgi:hypothetical protein
MAAARWLSAPKLRSQFLVARGAKVPLLEEEGVYSSSRDRAGGRNAAA